MAIVQRRVCGGGRDAHGAVYTGGGDSGEGLLRSGKRAKGVGALDEGWNARRWTGGGGGGVVGIVRWAAAWGRT